ncbi:MAG: HDOD domain-containing protein [Planctomycetes bacterium]|nr:HDOD domain-containing protein [Planctomycetota bacterium]
MTLDPPLALDSRLLTLDSLRTIDWDGVWERWMGRRGSSALPPWVKLPSLPAALMEFTQKAQDPSVGPGELGRIIDKDAGLTCQLLRHVNSAAAGFGQQARTAQEALVRMGVRGASLYLLTTGMDQVLKSSQSRLVNFAGFWCANLERALFAREVAGLLGADRELAFTGAMLSDCLLPLLANKATQTYVRFLEGQKATPRSIIGFEENEFGWNHAEATACLLSGWKLPRDVICCVLLHHKGLAMLKDAELRRTAVAAVAIASLLPDQLQQEPSGLALLWRLEQSWPSFRLEALAERVAARFAETETGVTNPFPLARRVRRPR